MKAACLNTVTIYIPWNFHERQRGVYDFAADGWDLVRFIKLVHEMGLHLIVRPGPYICAEWEFGGLPSWLFHDPSMVVRSSKYPPYLKHVERYFAQLLPVLARFAHQKGGPIIAFQVENELGSYKSSPDQTYLRFLAELFHTHGINELLFTSDNSQHLKKGGLPELLATVNFNQQPVDNLNRLHAFQPGKPLMVAEFWPGWFDHWAENHHTMTASTFSERVDQILSYNSSVNLYMFTGGTNFAFWNGANHQQQFEPTITSYDYDALISECGDVHPTKFQAFRDLLTKHGLILTAELPPIPPNPTKRAYGVVGIEQSLPLNIVLGLVAQSITLLEPIFMEFLSINGGSGQGYGWIVYRTHFRGNSLTMRGHLHDRAQIFVNGRLVKTIYNQNLSEISETINPGSGILGSDQNVLEIFVENMGRVNDGIHLNVQRKGFQGEVSSNVEKLKDWEHIPLEFNSGFIAQLVASTKWGAANVTQVVPTLYRGWLKLEGNSSDTFLDMSSWTKGIVIVNGFNLGRYWNVGPQQTLYVPAPVLKAGKNEIIVFELEQPSLQLKFVDKPNLGKG
jgi:beta-galactosidase GanA